MKRYVETDDDRATFSPGTLRLVSADMLKAGARDERLRIRRSVTPSLRVLDRMCRKLFSQHFADDHAAMRDAIKEIRGAMMRAKAP